MVLANLFFGSQLWAGASVIGYVGLAALILAVLELVTMNTTRPERLAIGVVLLFFLFASVYRALHAYITGFFVPDEYGYYVNTTFGAALYPLHFNLAYDGRYFANGFNTVFFHLFGIDSIDKLVFLMPFYFLIWISVIVFCAYKTILLMGFRGKAVSGTTILSIGIPVFSLFSVGFLSEPVAVAMVMVGIYLTTRLAFSARRRLSFAYPALIAASYAAAAYTRVDFGLFLALGIIPVLYAMATRPATARRARVIESIVAAVTYSLPAILFSRYPQGLGANLVQSTSAIIQTTGVRQLAAPGTNWAFATVRFFLLSLVTGYTPVIAATIIVFFIVLFWQGLVRRNRTMTLMLIFSFLGIATLIGLSFFYSSSAGVSFALMFRQAYDAMPAFFMVLPLAFLKFGKRFYGLLVVGILLSALAGGAALENSLQTGLSTNYPFLSGGQSFLTLSYRVPLAQVRDYFLSATSSGPYLLMANTSALQYCNPGLCNPVIGNITYEWQLTPGAGRIGIEFQNYLNMQQLAALNGHTVYMYIEKGGDAYFTPSNAYLLGIASGRLNDFTVNGMTYSVEAQTIYNTTAFYFGKILIGR
jgi:hypothetical protein